MKNIRIGSFLSVVITLLVTYALVKWGIPAVSREVTTLPFPLPVPGTLMFFYMVLTLIALFLFVTFSDEGLDDFLRPVKKFLRGGYGRIPRAVVLTLIPVVAGWQIYEITVPKIEAPVTLRIQHPSSNFPKAFEDKRNPFANPTDADIDAFVGKPLESAAAETALPAPADMRIFVSSPVPSRSVIMPRPKFGCLTQRPTARGSLLSGALPSSIS